MAFRTVEQYVGIEIATVRLDIGQVAPDGHLVTEDSEPDIAEALSRLAGSTGSGKQSGWCPTPEELEAQGLLKRQ